MKLSASGAYVVDDTGHCVSAREIMAEVERLRAALKEEKLNTLVAAEIAQERLVRAERAEAALRAIAEGTWNRGRDGSLPAREFARAALAGEVRPLEAEVERLLVGSADLAQRNVELLARAERAEAALRNVAASSGVPDYVRRNIDAALAGEVRP